MSLSVADFDEISEFALAEKVCEYCKGEIEADSKFCRNCETDKWLKVLVERFRKAGIYQTDDELWYWVHGQCTDIETTDDLIYDAATNDSQLKLLLHHFRQDQSVTEKRRRETRKFIRQNGHSTNQKFLVNDVVPEHERERAIVQQIGRCSEGCKPDFLVDLPRGVKVCCWTREPCPKATLSKILATYSRINRNFKPTKREVRA